MKNNIANILEEKQMTISELSKNSKVGRTTLSEIINSPTIPEKTKIQTLQKVAQALNVNFKSLFSEEIYFEVIYWKYLNDFLDLNKESDLKKSGNNYFLFHLIVLKISSETIKMNIPLIAQEYLPDGFVLTTQFLSNLDLEMLKNKDIDAFNDLQKFGPFSIRHFSQICAEYDLTELSKPILESYKKEVIKTMNLRKKQEIQMQQYHLGEVNPKDLEIPKEIYLNWESGFPFEFSFDSNNAAYPTPFSFKMLLAEGHVEKIKGKKNFYVMAEWYGYK